MIIDPVNATAVNVSWTASSIYFARLGHTSFCTASGVVRSEYETTLSPGVASTVVVIEDDLTLDESKEGIEHIFTLHFVLVDTYGEKIEATFTFGM